jgi:phage/conjugal plasmid C-4 type zinc finger TraR family protein
MTDDMDMAQDLAEALREDALRKHKRGRAHHTGNGSLDCERCGDPIPLERLHAVPDAQYCVDCQQRIERQGRWPA